MGEGVDGGNQGSVGETRADPGQGQLVASAPPRPSSVVALPQSLPSNPVTGMEETHACFGHGFPKILDEILAAHQTRFFHSHRSCFTCHGVGHKQDVCPFAPLD